MKKDFWEDMEIEEEDEENEEEQEESESSESEVDADIRGEVIVQSEGVRGCPDCKYGPPEKKMFAECDFASRDKPRYDCPRFEQK